MLVSSSRGVPWGQTVLRSQWVKTTKFILSRYASMYIAGGGGWGGILCCLCVTAPFVGEHALSEHC